MVWIFLRLIPMGRRWPIARPAAPFSNNLNWWQDHGPANYDRTHTATISYVWELPFGRGRQFGGSGSRAVDLVLGGWAFSGVATFESGLPFTPNISGTNQVFADLNQVRADQIGNASVPNPNANLWFNPAAFTRAPEPRPEWRCPPQFASVVPGLVQFRPFVREDLHGRGRKNSGVQMGEL